MVIKKMLRTHEELSYIMNAMVLSYAILLMESLFLVFNIFFSFSINKKIFPCKETIKNKDNHSRFPAPHKRTSHRLPYPNPI